MAGRLLIVEDDRHLRQMLSWDLEDLGYEVSAAQSCDEALALARTQAFDLALIDYNLPDGDGVALMEALHGERPDLQVLLCSGVPTPDNVARAIRKGAYAFVAKPVQAERLHRAFEAALGDAPG